MYTIVEEKIKDLHDSAHQNEVTNNYTASRISKVYNSNGCIYLCLTEKTALLAGESLKRTFSLNFARSA